MVCPLCCSVPSRVCLTLSTSTLYCYYKSTVILSLHCICTYDNFTLSPKLLSTVRLLNVWSYQSPDSWTGWAYFIIDGAHHEPKIALVLAYWKAVLQLSHLFDTAAARLDGLQGQGRDALLCALLWLVMSSAVYVYTRQCKSVDFAQPQSFFCYRGGEFNLSENYNLFCMFCL